MLLLTMWSTATVLEHKHTNKPCNKYMLIRYLQEIATECFRNAPTPSYTCTRSLYILTHVFIPTDCGPLGSAQPEAEASLVRVAQG